VSETNTTPLKSQSGFIGYFDILGYQAFLENNSPEVAAERVLGTLLKLDQDTPSKLLESMAPFYEGNDRATLDIYLKDIKWLVFSDTVLMTMVTDEIPDDKIEIRWLVFLLQCSYLWRKMFDFGLPLRGAITRGSFVVQGTCFAGKSIVNAYKSASSLNFAGAVITQELSDWSKKIIGQASHAALFHQPYLVPRKGKASCMEEILNVAATYPHERKWDGDIRQLVHECFWKHEKNIGEDVSDKIENTEKLLRFLKMKYPWGFTGNAP
jgi:hypothetical protein